MRATTNEASATKALAAAVASLANKGDVILLAGDLGAGKTAFAQGFGAALGIVEPITSPTFTLARQYEGRLVMHHLDVYRLERFSELADIGISELLDEGGVLLIEWGDAIAPALPADFLEIRFAYTDVDDERVLEFNCVGPRWTTRTRDLRDRLATWLEA